MASVCFYFQVHQPRRIKRYRIFDIGKNHSYFDDSSEANLNNKKIIEKVAVKCYVPTNNLLTKLLKRHPQFRVSFSFSGVFLDQLQQYAPDVLASFQDLCKNPHVEVLSETYHHSLSFLYSQDEFIRQVILHRKKIEELFDITPSSVFRNTELIYNNDLAHIIAKMGYKGILAEGADHILSGRSPNYLYQSPDKDIAILLKNYKLSDDIAFRFSSKEWEEYPLTVEKFGQWIGAVVEQDLIGLFMDYETFGEHQWVDTGIFSFLERLPEELLKNPQIDFVTPTEALSRYTPIDEMDVSHFVSWADIERDLSAWLSNSMQKEAAQKLYSLESRIHKTHNEELIRDWRLLQTSDHFYYMCTKWFADGDVHKYFNPYDSPYEAFITYMNVLGDLRLRLNKKAQKLHSDPDSRHEIYSLEHVLHRLSKFAH